MAAVASNHEQQEYGLSYDSDFLNSLPVLSPPVASPSCSTSPESQPLPSHLPPIRSVSASQFADMHLRYLTTHAPDSVIFPFLHGLEGDNDAQNAFFFANGSMTAVNGSTTLGKDGVDTIDREKLKARVPRFRGLVWVASDEDEVEEYERAMKARHQGHSSDLHSSRTQDDFDDDIEDDIEEDDYSTSSLDDDDEVEDDDFAAMAMDIDDHVDLNAGVVGMDVDLHGQHDGGLLDHGEGAHMHPVVHAHRPALSAIDTGSKAHGHRLSNASSTSSFDSTASDEPSTSASPSPPPSATSASPCLPSPPTPPTSLPATPATPQLPETSRPRDVPDRVTLTSTFKPRELLCIDRETGETRFVEPKVPDGISLRNFGIQVPIFATLSDIVVYSPRGNTKAALAVASHFAHAVETKRRQRAARGQTDLLHYNVFVLRATPEEMVRELPHVVSRMADEVVGSGAHTTGTDALTVTETHGADSHPLTKHQQCTMRKANTISFAQREKDEMRELTQASEIMTLPVKDEEERKEFSASTPASKWDPTKGQVFLGNANDVPFPPTSNSSRKDRAVQDEWELKSNDPALGYGYDICIECDDMAPFPSPAHMRAAEEHVARLEKRWADHCLQEMEKTEGSVDGAREIPVRPPPSAGLVVHLPFPSTVMYAGNSVLPFVSWLEGLMKPVEHPLTVAELRERKESEAEAKRIVAVSSNTRAQNRRSTNAATVGHSAGHSFGGPSSLPPPTAFPTSFFPVTGSSPAVPATSTVNAFTRMRSTSATQLSTPSSPAIPLAPIRTRPLKILVYSADGYTESSSLALCLLMSLRRLNLPEAYLELQVEKRRSFFVYQNEMGPLKRIEARLERDRLAQAGMLTKCGRSSANSVSFAPSTSIPNSFLSSLGPASHPGMLGGEALSSSAPNPSNDLALMKRPRASTLPPTSSIVSNHQMWFDDPRFDGSFPSRVLPFLYLGNLNHAANAYMLHALGITHVVSVGECALIPPENAGSHCATTAKPGSLWIEEKEGRIKVLDIKDVCDDGIDSLEPQLPPICEWIDEARRTGGKVLVHCRVGVSRSATVTIAYVMKHLNIPLVDAYLIVRSRRLSVLIQPNMRLLYNLIGWEIRLAQERAAGDKDRLAGELARCLNWPYLAKEVHALNEKYLH